MSTLNIMCAICSEFYQSSDYVYSTTECGHLFHHQCLLRWLSRSLTCPQCRRTCHRNRVHRVFLNFGERTEEDDALDEILTKAPNWLPINVPDIPGPIEVPEGAIKAGQDASGNDVYVGRAYFKEDLLPANFVPALGGAYASWGGREHFLSVGLEILNGCECEWISAANGGVSPNAIVTGYAENGESLYTGRAQYKDILLPGKIHPSHHVLYMPYNGQEVNIKEYEVLAKVTKEEPK